MGNIKNLIDNIDKAVYSSRMAENVIRCEKSITEYAVAHDDHILYGKLVDITGNIPSSKDQLSNLYEKSLAEHSAKEKFSKEKPSGYHTSTASDVLKMSEFSLNREIEKRTGSFPGSNHEVSLSMLYSIADTKGISRKEIDKNLSDI